jgi:hypothetical protein
VAISVRRATDDDVDAIARVGHGTWPSTYGFAGEEYVEHGLATWYSDDAIRASLRDTEMWLANAEGDVVGIGNVDLRRDPPTIWKLYVLPDQHGFVETGREPADDPRWPEQVWVERPLVAASYEVVAGATTSHDV